MKENEKYQIIKKLVDSDGNKKSAALKIGCTTRHINRLIKGYQSSGKEFFVHGNHSNKPATTIPEETKLFVLNLYQTKYYDANLTHFQELLAEHEDIQISVSSITSILRKEYIISPKAHRVTRKKLKKELKTLKKNAKSKKQEFKIQSSLLDIEDRHPRRPRAALLGEMIQMDASEYIWFGDTKAYLHIAVDDASGILVGAWFDEQETLNGYYNVLHQILLDYGIPYQFFTDNRTVFEYKKKQTQTLKKIPLRNSVMPANNLGLIFKHLVFHKQKGGLKE